ncbi:hypothetical protein SHL15_5544 [Streptomyces hygroscopicus subsp. limoneus]|nr:hypothetical protein SHL15_5544 [Streptomyces hygroscopicus subsp. limoneus]
MSVGRCESGRVSGAQRNGRPSTGPERRHLRACRKRAPGEASRPIGSGCPDDPERTCRPCRPHAYRSRQHKVP